MLRHVAAVALGFGSGVVVSAAVFAFITAIGVVTRLAQKTGTRRQVRLYESAISVGGIFGALAGFLSFLFPLGMAAPALLVVVGLATGVFYGVLVMSLAETLNVMPILMRRTGLAGSLQGRRGLFLFVVAIALGKMAGALLYALVPGFYSPGEM